MKQTLSRGKRAAALLLLTLLFLVPAVGHAQIPQTISYQGSLTDRAGIPLNGPVSMTFGLYDTASGGFGLRWAERQTVTVANGAFNVVLGADAGNPLDPALFDIQLYLGIAVGGDAEMTPRQALAAVGYAFRAKGVEPDAITGREIADGTIEAADIAANAVGPDEIAAGAVTAGEIATGAVGPSALASDAVTASKIATGAVGANEIATGAVIAGKVAAGAVGASEIATDAVGASEIAAGAVGSSEIATSAVGSAEIADGSVGADEIAAGAIGASEIAADAVGRSEISGTEVSLYQVLNFCGGGGSTDLTLASTCTSLLCSGQPRWLTCNGACISTVPATCNNTRVGYLLSP